MIVVSTRLPISLIAPLVGLFVLGAGIGFAVDRGVGENAGSQEVSRIEARDVLNELLEVNIRSDIDIIEYCADWASSQGMCRHSAEQLVGSKRGVARLALPKLGSATIEIGPQTQVGRIAIVRGDLQDGQQYKGAIEVVRLKSGDLAVVDPIYWLDRTISTRGYLSSP